MGFLQLVEAHGSYAITAVLKNSNEENVWNWSANQPLYHPEPLFAHQLIFHEWILFAPNPGRYRLEVHANGEELVVQSLCIGPTEFFLKKD